MHHREVVGVGAEPHLRPCAEPDRQRVVPALADRDGLVDRRTRALEKEPLDLDAVSREFFFEPLL